MQVKSESICKNCNPPGNNLPRGVLMRRRHIVNVQELGPGNAEITLGKHNGDYDAYHKRLLTIHPIFCILHPA